MIRFLIFIAVVAGALVLSAAASGEQTLPGDAAVQRFVQRAPQPPARWLADFGNWIGSARAFAVIACGLALAFVVARRWWDAAFLLGALAARLLNGALKILMDSPRPTADLVRVTEIADGLGFPSGHAMGSVLGYGAIALLASRVVAKRWQQRLVRFACAAIVLNVGFGRIYVGAHWPSDVLGGYLWGLLLLAMLYAAIVRIEGRFSRNHPPAPRILGT